MQTFRLLATEQKAESTFAPLLVYLYDAIGRNQTDAEKDLSRRIAKSLEADGVPASFLDVFNTLRSLFLGRLKKAERESITRRIGNSAPVRIFRILYRRGGSAFTPSDLQTVEADFQRNLRARRWLKEHAEELDEIPRAARERFYNLQAERKRETEETAKADAARQTDQKPPTAAETAPAISAANGEPGQPSHRSARPTANPAKGDSRQLCFQEGWGL